jgi:hypothetical protein
MRVGLTSEISNGAFGFGLFVLPYLFRFGLQNMDHSAGVYFLGERASSCCHICPMYKLPIIGTMSFSNVEPENNFHQCHV